jgi:hypothetical protein
LSISSPESTLFWPKNPIGFGNDLVGELLGLIVALALNNLARAGGNVDVLDEEFGGFGRVGIIPGGVLLDGGAEKKPYEELIKLRLDVGLVGGGPGGAFRLFKC